jgi:hypothetical protein
MYALEIFHILENYSAMIDSMNNHQKILITFDQSYNAIFAEYEID